MSVNVISLENRKGTKLGESRKVRRGYARYLTSGVKRKALRDDALNAAQFEHMRVELVQKEAEQLQAAQRKAEELKALAIQLGSRVSGEGRLYGSLGVREIAEAISQAGVPVDKSMVHLPMSAIRELGDYPVAVHLHHDVVVEVTVRVVSAVS